MMQVLEGSRSEDEYARLYGRVPFVQALIDSGNSAVDAALQYKAER